MAMAEPEDAELWDDTAEAALPGPMSQGLRFFGDMPHTVRVEPARRSWGSIDVLDAYRLPESDLVRASPLVVLGDIAMGIPPAYTFRPHAAITVDLDHRTLRATTASRLRFEARVVKQGRRLAVCDCTFREASGAIVAYSTATFIGAPRPDGDDQPPPASYRCTGAMHKPFPEQLGVRVVEAGVVELDRTTYVRQITDTIQGGAMALIAEVATESLLGRPIVDIALRYLSAVREGPARATAAVLDDRHARVEIVDTARTDGALATVAVVRTI
jgi:acyl-coenzyme A thioesterase PaaI-like protein